MSIFKKLLTAVRGGATEIGQAAVDAQALRIMDQEIRDAENALQESEKNLTAVMAQKMASERKVHELEKKIEEHEGYAIAALEKGNETLAAEIAEQIAEFSDELAPLKAVYQSQVESVNNLKRTIKQTKKKLDATKREVTIIKSTESVQKAQAAVVSDASGSTSSMNSALDSMKRIKARQQENADRMKAAEELSNEAEGGDLAAKMRDAGITPGAASGNDILAKLKAKQQGASADA